MNAKYLAEETVHAAYLGAKNVCSARVKTIPVQDKEHSLMTSPVRLMFS